MAAELSSTSTGMPAPLTPTARRAPPGSSPPAKRLQGIPRNSEEEVLKDALDDHAVRLDRHHAAIRDLVAMNVVINAKIEDRDKGLLEKLKLLEERVTQNESRHNASDVRLATTEQAVLNNDTELKRNLHTMERRLESSRRDGGCSVGSPAPPVRHRRGG